MAAVAGIMTQLRDQMPLRPLSRVEAMRIAEQQALLLLKLSGVKSQPIPDSVITDLPRIHVERLPASPVSGAAHWSSGRWFIVLHAADVPGRQRFTLAHEFKHVLDNPFIHLLYPESDGISRRELAEQVCDHFAASLLMPKAWVRREYNEGLTDVRVMARLFNVSLLAMQVRLVRLGLQPPRPRCQVAA
jgi:predicted transcriptional regulator